MWTACSSCRRHHRPTHRTAHQRDQRAARPGRGDRVHVAGQCPDSPLGLADEHRETGHCWPISAATILLRNGWYWENFRQRRTCVRERRTPRRCRDGTGRRRRARRTRRGCGRRPDRRHPAVYEWADRRRRMPTSPRQSATRPERRSYTAISCRGLPRGTARGRHARGLAAFLAETDAGIAQGALDTSSPSLQ